jgi:hypothetical protein
MPSSSPVAVVPSTGPLRRRLYEFSHDEHARIQSHTTEAAALALALAAAEPEALARNRAGGGAGGEVRGVAGGRDGGGRGGMSRGMVMMRREARRVVRSVRAHEAQATLDTDREEKALLLAQQASDNTPAGKQQQQQQQQQRRRYIGDVRADGYFLVFTSEY